MISDFPKFTKLDISHKKDIKQITTKFDPYSDFNFTSLFVWDTKDNTSISNLNGNLVIRMPDYISGKNIYSILGNSKIDESIHELLKTTRILDMVPEVVVDSISKKSDFNIEQNVDQFDYIYRISELARLPGGRYRGKRKRISKFLRENIDSMSLRKIRFSDKSDITIIKQLFYEWVIERERTVLETESEGLALNRMLANASELNLMGLLIYIDGLCVGYSINEILDDDYAICHFQKTKLRFEYIDIFFSSLVAKELHHYGCINTNWEQDLGIQGLRELKESYLPERYLKKYTIALKS